MRRHAPRDADTGWSRAARVLDRLSIASGHVVGWLIVPMVLSLVYEVAARYIFNAPTLWAYDMTFMLYGAFFMLGSAYTLQRKGHIRTDSLYSQWSVRRQAWMDLLGYLLMFFPFVAIFLWAGWGYFWKAFMTGERFVSSPWMPLTWPFKSTMPLAGLLLAVQGVSEVFKCVHALQRNEWPEQDAIGPRELT